MKQIPKKNSVKTFGCRLNLLESELIEQSLDFSEKNIFIQTMYQFKVAWH